MKEIQDISELAGIPVGTTVIYEGMKIKVKDWSIGATCTPCYFAKQGIDTCSKVGCGSLMRPDKKDAIYVRVRPTKTMKEINENRSKTIKP
jgi:hypothetical protein